MLYNVTLIKSESSGKQSWKLLGPDGEPVEAFSTFADSLLRKHPLNTRRTYCRHLAEFLDYIIEAAAALRAGRRAEPLTRDVLEEVVESYHDYLVYGDKSGNRIAELVHRARPSPRLSAASSALKHAPVRKFLKLSEVIRRQTHELTTAGLKKVNVDPQALFSDADRKLISPQQRRAMLGTSMIAGVVRGGPKLMNSVVLPAPESEAIYDYGRAFPFDKISDFIAQLPTARDRALYALLAASGCRTHEALQLLFDDIDIEKGEVVLRDPKSRANHPSYLALSPMEREVLAWKGRSIESTVLIEPFTSMFFEAMQRYLEDEYVPHGRHQFIFQYMTGEELGDPYFLSASTSRREIFHRAVSAVDIDLRVSGPHSLRHAYGTYLLNYFPRLNGDYGLPPAVVQQLMGHKTLKATMKYARYDEDLIRAELRHANAMIFSGGKSKSLLQLKLEALTAQVRKVESEMRTVAMRARHA